MAKRERVRVEGHPGIYRESRPDGADRWLVSYRDGLGRQRTRTYRTRAEAIAARRGFLTDRDRGTETRAEGSRTTFAAYSSTYVDRHPEWRPSTRQTTVDRLSRINRATFARKPLTVITTGDVRDYVAGMIADEYAPRTIAAHRNLIATILGEAVDDRLIGHNPATAVRVPKPSQSAAERSQLLTVAQVRTILDALPAWWKAFGWLIAWTGLRGGEAAGLTVDRVDLLHRTITVDRQLVGSVGGRPVFGPPKSDSGIRVLPIGDDVAALLADHLSTRPLGPDGLLFTTRQRGPMTRGARSDAWRRATAGLDLPEGVRGWHALRHTYGSSLVRDGVDFVTVSAHMGHRDAAETIATYAHVDPSRLVETANVAATALPRTARA